MVINPLLAIELYANPMGNPTDHFYWRQKCSSLNVLYMYIINVIQYYQCTYYQCNTLRELVANSTLTKFISFNYAKNHAHILKFTKLHY